MAHSRKTTKRRSLHISYKEREYFSENLSLLLKSAVPIGEALDTLLLNARSRSFKKALRGMQEDISAGYNLAVSLERSGIVGSQTLALVKLGEASGHLVENLQLAAVQEAKRHTFVTKVRSALIYPTFVISLTIIVGLGVAWFLLPRLAATFAQLRVKLPVISRVLISFGTFLKEHGLVAVPTFIGSCMLISYLLFGAPGTKRVGRTLLFHIPGIGRLIREVEVAQFGYLLGTLVSAGLSITQALTLLKQSSTVPQYQKLYQHLANSIDNGLTFKDSFTKYTHSRKMLPPSVQQMIIAAERSGSLPEVLLTIGKTYEQKSDITTQNLETLIEPVLLVLVAGGVMLVAIAVILPIYSLVGGLNQ
ncbi:MAG TPA: type II secretion system F family protein [Candidatus Saccharimonadia bacterium]|nr:type II secretion system F family protein [Candidatus Saccharimonadia bacterium]